MLIPSSKMLLKCNPQNLRQGQILCKLLIVIIITTRQPRRPRGSSFSLSFEVDGLGVKIGSLANECLSHLPPEKVGA